MLKKLKLVIKASINAKKISDFFIFINNPPINVYQVNILTLVLFGKIIRERFFSME